jgi:hypothetical protein
MYVMMMMSESKRRLKRADVMENVLIKIMKICA